MDIHIIDAPCGVGKSSWAFQFIDRNPNSRIIYSTPFLDEIQRISRRCRNPNGSSRFCEPHNFGISKTDSFRQLVDENRDIAVTHCTLMNTDEETFDKIKTQNRILILDEVVDMIIPFNECCEVENDVKQSISSGDIEAMLANGEIEIGEDGYVKWTGYTGGSAENYKNNAVRAAAKQKQLYCAKRTVLLKKFSPKLFTSFDEVYILTYMLESSLLKPFLEIEGIAYEKHSIRLENGEYCLVDYDHTADHAFRARCNRLIQLNERSPPYLDEFSLSVNWFKSKASTELLDKLKGTLMNVLRKKMNGHSSEIMWTCPEKFHDALKGNGYTWTRQLTAEERQFPEPKRDKLERTLSCFVPCNARATNEFRDRFILAYFCNIFPNPMILDYYERDNKRREAAGFPPIIVDKDQYALGFLIQWVFRSRIRDGQPIQLFIASPRMKKIFEDWLNCVD